MAGLYFSHPFRFFSGHGLTGFVLLAAVALDFIYERVAEKTKNLKPPVFFLVGSILFFHFLAPTLTWDMENKKLQLDSGGRALVQHLKNQDATNFKIKNSSIYFPKEYGSIVKIIKENSKPQEIIWSDLSYAGGILGLLSGRATSSSMLREVKSFKPFDELQSAKILIWFKTSSGKPPVTPPEGMNQWVKKYHLKFIAETDFAVIFENPKAEAKREIPKPLMPTLWVNFILVGIFSLIWMSRRAI